MYSRGMSNETKATIWIDLTDMVAWRGHFTGIQRVVHSYASRFSKDGARFFIYDLVAERHVEVGFDFLLKNKTHEDPLPFRRQRIKRIIGKPYYMLNPKQKASLRPAVRIFNRVARTIIHELLGEKAIYSPYHKYPSADFSRNDITVLIGAGWNNSGSLEKICEIRKKTGIKLVQHINDILPIYQPHLFADELTTTFNPYVERTIKTADVITVISKATERDLTIYAKEKKVKAPAIKVVRLGEDVESTKSDKPEHFPATGEFVLSVGTFEIRKNYALLYQAAKLAQLEGREFPSIVIVGRRGWLTEDLAHIIQRDPFTKTKIFWIDNASDAELNWMYENCMFTVFPSLCEGWGLPIVESLQHGKMCITSNVSSMLEIGVGLVDYFSPYDARSCMDKILQYSNDRAYVDSNRNVKDNYQTFTWDQSYEVFKQAVLSA